MIRGIIKPNGYASHHHGSISFHAQAPREFIVDESADRVIDQPGLGVEKRGETLPEYAERLKGKPLVLTPAAYAELMKKNGGPIVIEPVGNQHADRIADLEKQLAEANAKIEKLSLSSSNAEVQRIADIAEERAKRIAELEQQLAAKGADKAKK